MGVLSTVAKTGAWTAMGLTSCFVAHSLMGPLGLTPVASAVDSWISTNIGSLNLSSVFLDIASNTGVPSGEIFSNINPKDFASCVMNGGDVHSHGFNIYACVS